MLRWILLAAIAESAKVLVLFENPQVRISHSKVLSALEAAGLELTFKVTLKFYFKITWILQTNLRTKSTMNKCRSKILHLYNVAKNLSDRIILFFFPVTNRTIGTFLQSYSNFVVK